MIKAMQLFEHRQRAAYYRSRALFEILVRPTERHQTVTGKIGISILRISRRRPPECGTTRLIRKRHRRATAFPRGKQNHEYRQTKSLLDVHRQIHDRKREQSAPARLGCKGGWTTRSTSERSWQANRTSFGAPIRIAPRSRCHCHSNFGKARQRERGGVEGGRVIGSSDRTGGHPRTEPQTPESMAATIYHCLGLPKTLAGTSHIDVTKNAGPL